MTKMAGRIIFGEENYGENGGNGEEKLWRNWRESAAKKATTAAAVAARWAVGGGGPMHGPKGHK